MSVDKLVDSTQLDSDLTSVANAIRTKGGTSASLSFPSGFVDAVGAIQTGGSGDNTKYLNLIARTGTSFEDEDVESIGANSFRGWTGLTSLSLPNCKTLGDSCFYGCSGIGAFYLPELTKINGGNAFNGAGANTSAIVLPLLNTYPSSNAFNSFSGKYIDLGEDIGNINQYMFNNNTRMNVLILRKTTIAALSNVNAFNNSPFASGKAGGTIYIPKALYDHLGDNSSSDYQNATNWATVYGYGTITWAKIEGSQYENYYADGTAIPTS